MYTNQNKCNRAASARQEFLQEQEEQRQQLHRELADLQEAAKRQDEERDVVESDLRLSMIRSQGEVEGIRDRLQAADRIIGAHEVRGGLWGNCRGYRD
jgi:hypothetical protein